MSEERSVARGVIAGAVGGLLASWVMNQFMAKAGPALQRGLQSEEGKLKEERAPKQEDEMPKEDATMKAADAIVRVTTGGKHLTREGKELGGPIVHYSFGAIMGGVYGGLAEKASPVTAGFGTAFGSALFAGADLVAVPALKLSSASGDQPVSSLATPFAAHLVYGATTELVRRLVRAVL